MPAPPLPRMANPRQSSAANLPLLTNPRLPQLSPNNATLGLKEQIERAVALEVNRRPRLPKNHGSRRAGNCTIRVC